MNQETSLTRSKPSTKQKLKQLMVEKKRKTIQQRLHYAQLMADKSNNLTMTKKHCLLLMAEKKLLNAKAN